MLLALFGHVAESRQAILSCLFDGLAQEDATDALRALWCGVLSSIATSHLLALHAHAGQLVDWTCTLPSLPAATSRAVLSSLLPLVPLHVDFGRHVLLLLRKSLVAPETRTRALAVFGLCSLLRRGLLPKEDGAEADAIVALRTSCTLSPSLQSYSYHELRHVISSDAPADPAARTLLHTHLIETLQMAALPSLPSDGYSDGHLDGLVGQPSATFDAAWARSLLVRAVSGRESGGLSIYLPSLIQCIAAAGQWPTQTLSRASKLHTRTWACTYMLVYIRVYVAWLDGTWLGLA